MTETDDTQHRPYRMRNQIQTYAWGTRNTAAFIPKLLGLSPEPDLPYAELWLGTHPKAPSMIELPDGPTVALDAWVADHAEAALGPVVLARFGELPFLLKVLSAGEALSIQAHPNKAQAAALHAKDPDHYPDANHKPEIAIALDGLTALMGIKPFTELAVTLSRYPEMADFVGQELAERVVNAVPETLQEATVLARELVSALITRANTEPGALTSAVDTLAKRLSAQSADLGEDEELFLNLRIRYGSDDVGLLTLFLLNLVHLAPGEALYVEAGVPHAYLKGNIIECMANSDNVVRVGLTPKFKDAGTLLEIIDATPQKPTPLTGTTVGDACTVYETPADEFEIRRWSLAAGTEHRVTPDNRPAIVLMTKGRVDLVWEGGSEALRQGDALFVPAGLKRYALRAHEDSTLFEASVRSQG